MAYETNIGQNQLLYQIVLNGTPTIVKDLLSEDDLYEMLNWPINTWRVDKTYSNIEVLDGFIQPTSSMQIRHKPDGIAETFSSGDIAYFPYVDWHEKVYVSGSGLALVKFVIGFTRRAQRP